MGTINWLLFKLVIGDWLALELASYLMPRIFPSSNPIIAPYWDYATISYNGELRYAILTATTDPLLCNHINSYLTNSTGSSVSACPVDTVGILVWCMYCIL